MSVCSHRRPTASVGIRCRYVASCVDGPGDGSGSKMKPNEPLCAGTLARCQTSPSQRSDPRLGYLLDSANGFQMIYIYIQELYFELLLCMLCFFVFFFWQTVLVSRLRTHNTGNMGAEWYSGVCIRCVFVICKQWEITLILQSSCNQTINPPFLDLNVTKEQT